MGQCTLMLMVLLSGTAPSAEVSQVNAIPAPKASDQPTSNEMQVGQICVSVRHIRERITVGRGPRAIEIILGGGACEPPGSGISDISAGYATHESMSDYVEAETCAAYKAQVDQLWSTHIRRPGGIGGVRDVRVDSFVISGTGDLFNLESKAGRKAAARWIRQTLVVVRGCWNNFRDDQTRYVVDRLYAALAIRPD